MTRTEAPKDLVGRGWRNLARTTPELPVEQGQYSQVLDKEHSPVVASAGGG